MNMHEKTLIIRSKFLRCLDFITPMFYNSSKAVQVPGGLKRESGENPERTRRCNPGLCPYQWATHPGRMGKAIGVG